MAKRIEAAMKAANYTQTTLANAMGVTPQAIQQWVSDRTAPKGKRLTKLANVLGVSVSYLVVSDSDSDHVTNLDAHKLLRVADAISEDDRNNVYEVNRRSGKVPLISFVRAGNWCEAIDNYEPGYADEWLECPRDHSGHTYALRVVGDSMTCPYPGKPTYPEGVIIYVDPERPITNGCRIIAKLPNSNDVTFKEYREENGKRYLKPLNPQYPMIEISDETRICGVVIGQFVPE